MDVYVAYGAIAVAIIVILMPRVGILALAWRSRSERRRELLEHALKHLVDPDHHSMGAGEPMSLAEALLIPPHRAERVARELQERGLAKVLDAGKIALTEGGRELALHVVRAHRLWERYLSDEANLPADRLHIEAHRAEHRFSPEELDAIEAHLGHPVVDPHGDPIPTAEGVRNLDWTPIAEWPPGVPARLAHVEDEPADAFARIVALGLRPGAILRVLEVSNSSVRLLDQDSPLELPLEDAANVHVVTAPRGVDLDASVMRLSLIGHGESAEVVALDPSCQGFTRRRLQDMGLTAGALVKPALRNALGDPRGYSVRGTMLALRREQADQIWVRPVADPSRASEREVG